MKYFLGSKLIRDIESFLRLKQLNIILTIERSFKQCD